MWNTAIDAKYNGKGEPFTVEEWDQLLGSYRAISTDSPAIAFAEDLIAAYPKAKVILVERDLESWFESFDNAIITRMWSRFRYVVVGFDPSFAGLISETHRRWAVGWMGVKNAKEMREKARGIYKAHYDFVRRVTPKEQLLEYKLGDGWEPLCEFLGKEVPDVPFPRRNDQEDLREMLRIFMRRRMRAVAIGFAVYWVLLNLFLIAWEKVVDHFRR